MGKLEIGSGAEPVASRLGDLDSLWTIVEPDVAEATVLKRRFAKRSNIRLELTDFQTALPKMIEAGEHFDGIYLFNVTSDRRMRKWELILQIIKACAQLLSDNGELFVGEWLPPINRDAVVRACSESGLSIVREEDHEKYTHAAGLDGYVLVAMKTRG